MSSTESISLAVALAIQHGPLLVMLATALALRRSLGSWPVYVTALLFVTAAQFTIAAVRNGAPGLAVFAGMMTAPTLLFVLARRQVIPGLRRGQMTETDRARWIARHALPVRSAHHNGTMARLPGSP